MRTLQRTISEKDEKIQLQSLERNDLDKQIKSLAKDFEDMKDELRKEREVFFIQLFVAHLFTSFYKGKERN